MSFDPRVTPARPDLAAAHLRGQVEAARFVEGTEFEVFDPVAPVRRSPVPDAALETEALKGERVTIYEEDGEGFGWGQLHSDGYVGWLPMNALRAPGGEPTHKVVALRTILFPGRSIKAQPVEGLPLGCRLAVTGDDGELARLASGGFVPARHLAPLDAAAPDFVAVAERFIGVPYLWGGKTSLGIDCSGLMQVALTAGGVVCPRDSDMQRALGTAVPMRTILPVCDAAISCSGTGMWRSCATPPRCSTPMRSTWRSRPSRCGKPSRGSARPAATSSRSSGFST